MEDLHRIEYRVRPITRYVVTRSYAGEHYAGDGDMGEYANKDVAFEVATALCKAEHQRLGWPIDDLRIVYPEREESVTRVA